LRGDLPERVHGTRHWRLKKLMALNSLADARTELAALREGEGGLSVQAASLDEVGEALLTLHALYGFLIIFIHRLWAYSCFDNLSMNGGSFIQGSVSAHPEPVKGRTVVDRRQLEGVLSITSELRKSLSSTNLIESLSSVVREKIHRVKTWKAPRSQQILCWVAASILTQRGKMRRMRSMAQAEELLTALGRRRVAAEAA
jgi:hypothetical protein